MKSWTTWIGLSCSALFCAYFVIAVPSAVSKTANKADLVAAIESENDLVKLKELASGKVGLLCNYNAASRRLLAAATSFGFLTLAIFLIDLTSSRKGSADDH